jgi:RNA polymerase sigma factor (sigma-70 family)
MTLSPGKKTLSGSEIERVQLHLRGKTITIPICSPAIAFELIFEELRPKLIERAGRVVREYEMAEDIVQASFESAYRWLNKGTLYAIKHNQGYLIVKGDGSTRSSCQKRREKQELAQKELWASLLGIEAPKAGTQIEDIKRILSHWLLQGQPVAGMCILDEPTAWMHKIVQNNALKYYNEQKKHQGFLANPQHWERVEDPRCPNPEKEVIHQVEGELVRQCVATLPTHYREVIELRYFRTQDDTSFQDIASMLKRPTHTVTSQASRALKKLRVPVEEAFTK